MDSGKALEQELYDLYQAKQELEQEISAAEEQLCLYYCELQAAQDRAEAAAAAAAATMAENLTAEQN